MRIGLAGPFALDPFIHDRCLMPADYRDMIAWTPVCDLAVALPRRGHEVTVFTLNSSITVPFTVDATPGLRIAVGPMRPRARERMIDLNAGEVRALGALFQLAELDVIHAHWSYEYALAGARSTVPCVTTVHDCPPAIFQHTPNLYRFLRMLVGVRGMRASPLLTAVSPYMAGCVQRITGRRSLVIPNMLDEARMTLPRNAPNRALRLLAVSNGFGGRKNVSVALKSFAEVRRSCAADLMVLVGSGMEPGGEAWRWARANGCADGVEFVGPVSSDALVAVMDRCDVLVHPALEESFGMVLVEAMARGLPVIAGKASGGVPWVVGEAGLLVDVRDAQAIASAVSALSSDSSLYSRMSQSGVHATRARFGYDCVTPLYEHAYAHVTGASWDD